jgi:hypothetical protein
LLGAADRSGDGNITVQEAFEYARERTVRDSARYAPLPQHPSFEIDLRRRQDVVLTQIGASGSALELVQTQGPFDRRTGTLRSASADWTGRCGLQLDERSTWRG